MKKLLIALIVMIVSLACVMSAIQVPTSTSAPDPVSYPAPALDPTPTHVYTTYVVTSDVLEIRNGAGEVYRNIGYLERGDSVRIYETKKTTLEKCSEWARIDVRSWVCKDRLERK